MKATLNDNNAKLDHLDKSIRAAVEKRRKQIDSGMSIEQIGELADNGSANKVGQVSCLENISDGIIVAVDFE